MYDNPLTIDTFSKLLPPTLSGKVAVAVSGGADSMALALLMQQWCQQNKVSMVALTVDHQLRPHSKEEAEQVHAWLTGHGIEHHILTWQHDGVSSGIQKKAREARYALLFDWCQQHNVSALLTAHHALDQWETFMMRLSKGSGLRGLCGIRPVTPTPFGVLTRPFLTVHPNQLLKTLHHFGQSFIEDPSNENTNFTRIRFRRLYQRLEQEGVDVDSISKTIQRFQQVDDFLENLTSKAACACFENNYLILDHFYKQPPEIAHRLIQRWLQQTGEKPYPLPVKSLDRLYEKLMDPKFKGATACGCVLKRTQGGRVAIEKEVRKKSGFYV